MRDPLTPQQFTRIAVVAFIAFAAIVAVIHSRRGEEIGVLVIPEQEQADAISSELARCRTITPDQTVALDNCRRAWAANRRHFFAPAKPMPAQIPSASNAVEPAKSQDRITPIEAQSEKR